MKLKVTLTRSTIGSTQGQIATVKGLGLRKVRSSRVLENTPAVRGMVKKVMHLVDVEEIEVEQTEV
ncbi:MAG: 50S ribosomal protein L30 [Alphaproteobacteria bacterium]|nr:50S ribosomal protein L30 [Alphaproteobacteria bacterium]